MFENPDQDPSRFRNNPAKKKAALEDLGKFLDDWEAENGRLTKEELAWAHQTLHNR